MTWLRIKVKRNWRAIRPALRAQPARAVQTLVLHIGHQQAARGPHQVRGLVQHRVDARVAQPGLPGRGAGQHGRAAEACRSRGLNALAQGIQHQHQLRKQGVIGHSEHARQQWLHQLGGQQRRTRHCQAIGLSAVGQAPVVHRRVTACPLG